jgi:urease accessory protein UreE
LARLCYEVGNRHAAFYYDERGDGFLLPYDEPMKVMLEKLGFDTNITQARLLPENRVSSPTGHGDGHEHGHSHAHEHGHSRAHSHTHEHGHVHHGADTSGDGDA